MKRLIGVFAITAVAALAMTLTSFGKVFNETYKIDKGSALSKAACMNCHLTAKGGKLNPYGKDLQGAMREEKTKKLTAAVLKAVEGIDSDKDGKKNLEEIKGDSNPGVK